MNQKPEEAGNISATSEGRLYQASRPLYLTAGNFPSIAANTIQVAKMSAAYSRWLPELEVVLLSGLLPALSDRNRNLREMFGLSRDLKYRSLPLLPLMLGHTFGETYRPPKWFYSVVGKYAAWHGADLVFTRKVETAIETVSRKIPTVLEYHDPWENVSHLHYKREILLSENLLAIVVVTEGLRESYLRAGFPANKILVRPDAVDLDQYNPPREKDDCRKQLNLNLERPLCVYTGHVNEDKGISVLLGAAALLPTVDFLIVGGWDEAVTQFRNRAKQLNLSNVRFTGNRPHAEIPLYQFAADILLMPYASTAANADRVSPLKLFEYLAARRPIVSSDLAPIRAVLKDRLNSLLVPPDSTEKLAEAISYLLNNPGIAAGLAKSARQTASNYTWDERARSILEAIAK